MLRKPRLLVHVVMVVLGAVGAWIAVPVQAQICTPFTDVLASSAFCGNIQWLLNRGITQGCTATQYCPANFVRRDQIAAFLNRLADKAVFQQGGNAFGGNAVLGTNDAQPLDLRVNGARVMRYEPHALSPNVIGGHPANSVTAGVRGATIAGGGLPGDVDTEAQEGAPNRVTDIYGTVGGGYDNLAGNDAGTVTDRGFATVAGGRGNTATGLGSSIAGGHFNEATGAYSAIAGGYSNVASGSFSTVAGGRDNIASGVSSFAAGRRAVADQAQCFVFANWSGEAATGSCLGANMARFLLDHGLRVDYHTRQADGSGDRWVHMGDLVAGQTIATWIGAHLTDAGVWVDAASSKSAKTDFTAVDAGEVLEKVTGLEITTWRYRQGEGDVRHIGPMAEDFHAAFGVGYGPHTIADLDARGVALAAIQGLNAKLETKLAARDAEVAALRDEVAELRSLREDIARLRALLPRIAQSR
jgi:hypothetical protein